MEDSKDYGICKDCLYCLSIVVRPNGKVRITCKKRGDFFGQYVRCELMEEENEIHI